MNKRHVNFTQLLGVAIALVIFAAICGPATGADLLMHLRFDEGFGTVAADSSGNGHTGTLHGGVTWVPGKVGNYAVQFNLSSAYVTIPNFVPPSQFSLCFWFQQNNHTGTQAEALFSWGQPYGGKNDVNVWLWDANSTSLNALLSDLEDSAFTDCSADWAGECMLCYPVDSTGGIIPGGDPNLTNGLWHFYCMTVAAGGAGTTVYVDGVQQGGSTALGGAAITPSTDIFIGARYNLAANRFFGGAIDDLCIFGRPLSASEVKNLMVGVMPTVQVVNEYVPVQNPPNPPITLPDPNTSWGDVNFAFPLRCDGPVTLNTEANTGLSWINDPNDPPPYYDDYHAGNYCLDFDANGLQAEVIAAKAGTVVNVITSEANHGPVVDIYHRNGYFTEYREFRLPSHLPRVGQPINQGDQIGYLKPGNEKGVLHFQVKYEPNYIAHYEPNYDPNYPFVVQTGHSKVSEQHLAGLTTGGVYFLPTLSPGFLLSKDELHPTEINGLIQPTPQVTFVKGLARSQAQNTKVAVGDFGTLPGFTTSDTGFVNAIGGLLTLFTGSPVWAAALVTVSDQVDSVSFDVDFQSPPGAEGLLSVFWEGQLIGTVDERYANEGLSNYAFSLGRQFSPGLYTLAFRLDPFTSTQSVAAITNVSVVKVPEPVNQPPLVDAGADATVMMPNGVMLAGAVSDDNLPNGTCTAAWSMVSGPGTVAFANPAAASTTATFSTAGTYMLQLTASDSVLTGTSNVTVTVLAPADFNGDGKVDGVDFLIWQSHYPTASGATPDGGDANGDGKVDGVDFLIWQANYHG